MRREFPIGRQAFVLALLCLLTCNIPVSADVLASLDSVEIESMEFRDQSIADIAKSLGMAAGLSLWVDDSVEGRASWYFPKGSMRASLDAFLLHYGCCLVPEGNAWIISKVAFRSTGAIVECETRDVNLETLVRIIARRAGVSIVFDALPKVGVDIHGFVGTMDELLTQILVWAPDFELSREAQAWALRKKVAGAPRQEKPPFTLSHDGAGYNLDVEKARCGALIAELLGREGKEADFFAKSDSVLEGLHYTGKDFSTLLELICALSNLTFSIEGDVYHFFDRPRREVLRKYEELKTLHLAHIGAADAIALLPGDLAGSTSIKLDRSNNAVLIYGGPSETGPVERFFEQLDSQIEAKPWRLVPLRYLKAKDAITRLGGMLGSGEAMVLTEQNSLMLSVPSQKFDEVCAVLAQFDVATLRFPVSLRYIKSEDFFKALPPSVVKEDFVDSGSGLLWFCGTEARYKSFLPELARMDRPKPQIRYDVLVVQYFDGESLALGAEGGKNRFSLSLTKPDSESSFVAGLGNAFSMDFDVLGSFGLNFGASLSAQLEKNRARLIADTSLCALSGQEVKFQNTQTYRYVQHGIDPDTGKPLSSAVTREITSGFILVMNAWVSGDGVVSITVNATLSSRGGSNASSASSDGSDPANISTTERVLQTQCRARSGEAIMVGAFRQRSEHDSNSAPPIGGNSEIASFLLGSRSSNLENSEVAVYLVPVVQYTSSSYESAQMRLDRMGERFSTALREAGTR